MEISTVIAHIALILIAARFCSEVAGRLTMPPVIGELAAGFVLGPSLLGVVELDTVVQLLAEIGIILMLFQIGAKTNVGRLLRSGGKSMTVAAGGVIVNFSLCFLCCHYLFGLDFVISMMVAGTITPTSIGITVRALTDMGQSNGTEGQIVLGSAVIDDIIGILLLAILFDFATGGSTDYASVSKMLLMSLVFFLLTPLIAKTFAHLVNVFEPLSTLPGIVPTSIVSLLLLTSWVSHAVGLPMLLGGFVVGLALSKQFHIPMGERLDTDAHFTKEVQHQMKPIIQLFTPIFFVSIGLSVDLGEVDWSSGFFWIFSLTLTGLAVVSKILGALFIKENLYRRVAVGLSMVPRGEVGLIFAGIGRSTGLFNNEVYVTVIVVIVYTTVFTPFWLKWYFRKYQSQLDEPGKIKHQHS